MEHSVELIRDFVNQTEKTLAARRLYAASSSPWAEANQKLVEKCQAAAGETGFTIRLGATDIYFEKLSLINRPKREESFFFPLYRDGLRELTFAASIDPEDVLGFLKVLEYDKRSGLSSEDTVNYLWRIDLQSISHTAIDGIGDAEGDDSSAGGRDDFRALIGELAEKITNPSVPVTGQSYSFVLDADVKVSANDMQFDATTNRKAFEENPTVLTLTPEEVQELRAETGKDRDETLLERFIDILLIVLADPAKAVPGARLTPVFQKLLEEYWNSRDFSRLVNLLSRIKTVAGTAPSPENREVAAGVLARFISDERLKASFQAVKEGGLSMQSASLIWAFVGDELWDLLIGFWTTLPEGELRTGVTAILRRRLAYNSDLVKTTLLSTEAAKVRAGLSLFDERLDTLYAKELMGLTVHKDEAIRLKGVAAAARIGGSEAHRILIKALESDPSKSVRLYVFRVIASSNIPGLGDKLRALVTAPEFVNRPAWEREKYVKLLASVLGESARPLFESWIPKKRWFWQPKDFEAAELAFSGIAGCGPKGLEEVRTHAAAGGKLGEIAKRVVESSTRKEPGEAAATKLPAAGSTPPETTAPGSSAKEKR